MFRQWFDAMLVLGVALVPRNGNALRLEDKERFKAFQEAFSQCLKLGVYEEIAFCAGT